MLTRPLDHLRRNLVAYIALLVALSGTSYAAMTLPRNSVGRKQLKRNAVISSKVKDRSLLARDFKRGQLPRGAPGRQGPQGVQGPPGLQGAKGDKGDPTYKRTIVVSPVAGTTPADLLQNGTNLRNAIASITDASDAKPYLVYLEPGMYNLGSTPLTLKSNVDVAGSSEHAVNIRASVASQGNGGAIIAAQAVELRDLTISNSTGEGVGVGDSIAVYAKGVGFNLTRVTAISSTLPPTTSVGVFLDDASPRITDSTLIGWTDVCAFVGPEDWGLYVKGAGSPNVLLTSTDVSAGNCKATAAVLVSGTLRARWSSFLSTVTSIAVSGNAATAAYLGGAEMRGAPYVADGATLTCAQSFSDTYAELGPGCT